MTRQSTLLMFLMGLLALLAWSREMGTRGAGESLVFDTTAPSTNYTVLSPPWIRDPVWLITPAISRISADANTLRAFCRSAEPSLARPNVASTRERQLRTRYSPVPKYVPELDAIVINGYTYPLHARGWEGRQQDTYPGAIMHGGAQPNIPTVVELRRFSVLRMTSRGDAAYVSRTEIVRQYIRPAIARSQYDLRHQQRLYRPPARPRSAVPTIPEKYRQLLAVKSLDFH